MTTIPSKALPTIPRLFGVLYALFIALFALDAIGEGDFWTALGAFAIHLIPAVFLLTVLGIAWFHELLGGLIYVGLGVAYVLATGGREAKSAYVIITGMLLLIGALFIVSWFVKQRRPDPSR
jgi:hypothetical protein